MRTRWMGLIGVGVLALAGCGTASAVSSAPLPVTTTTSGASHPATTPVATTVKRAAPVARVGSTIAVTGDAGDAAHVALLAVTDPAAGADQFTTPDPGTRFVGLKFEITNAGSASLTDDADLDAALVGSNDQTYQPSFDSIAGCTNFNSGTFALALGEAATGCVTFDVPTAVKVSKVQFGLDGGLMGTSGQWVVAAAP